MKCPECGTPMALKKFDETLRYKNEALTLHDLEGYVCDKCGETIFTDESYDRYVAANDGLIESVNKRNSPDIRAIRKKLGLTQAQAGKLFGGGVTAFSRYERGVAKPPVALTKLLSLLAKHPQLIKDI